MRWFQSEVCTLVRLTDNCAVNVQAKALLCVPELCVQAAGLMVYLLLFECHADFDYWRSL